MPFESRDGTIEIDNSVDEDRAVVLQVIGQQDPGWRLAQFDHRDANARRLDREHETTAEDLGEVGGIPSDVGARDVQKVELPERRHARLSPS